MFRQYNATSDSLENSIREVSEIFQILMYNPGIQIRNTIQNIVNNILNPPLPRLHRRYAHNEESLDLLFIDHVTGEIIPGNVDLNHSTNQTIISIEANFIITFNASISRLESYVVTLTPSEIERLSNYITHGFMLQRKNNKNCAEEFKESVFNNNDPDNDNGGTPSLHSSKVRCC